MLTRSYLQQADIRTRDTLKEEAERRRVSIPRFHNKQDPKESLALKFTFTLYNLSAKDIAIVHSSNSRHMQKSLPLFFNSIKNGVQWMETANPVSNAIFKLS